MNRIGDSLIFILLGIVLGISLIIFDIPITFGNVMYLCFSLFILIFGFYIFKLIYFNNKFKEYLNRPDYNLSKIEKKLNKMNDSNFKTSILINMSVAYSIKKDYESSLRVLYGVDISKANNRFKVVYYNNLIAFLLKKGDIQKAVKILEEQKKLFNKYLDNIQLAPALLETIERVEALSDSIKL